MLLSGSHSSSPLSPAYSTPSRSSYYSARSHQSLTSSPLASPSFSPTYDVQQRRRAQYKSTQSTSHRFPVTPAATKLLFRSSSQVSEDTQKSLLRGRLQARCREHAQKLRDQTINAQRSSDRSSDVFMDYDDDESDESDDAIMQDELFRRIMQSANHKKDHSYRVSYAMEVGSSFDPDIEDAHAWETELQALGPGKTEQIPYELEEEELREYAMIADFADIGADELEALGDVDDVVTEVLQPRQPPETGRSSDIDMS